MKCSHACFFRILLASFELQRYYVANLTQIVLSFQDLENWQRKTTINSRRLLFLFSLFFVVVVVVFVCLFVCLFVCFRFF